MIVQGSVCAQLSRVRGYFWRWMQLWFDRKNLVLASFRTWMLRWKDQKDFVFTRSLVPQGQETEGCVGGTGSGHV